ncbi:hypothetical protein WN943_011875 [Citrus x changshan-huyou]
MYGQYWGYELLTSVNDLHLVDEKKDLLALSKEARCWALRTRPLKMIYKLTKTRYLESSAYVHHILKCTQNEELPVGY